MTTPTARTATGSVELALLLPRMPHPLLCPDGGPGVRRLAEGYAAARAQLAALKPDLLVIYSVGWHSILGHLLQTDPRPTWTHVDEEFHALGAIDYSFPVDVAFSEAVIQRATARGLAARGVNYRGFPIDTGTLVAKQLLDPSGQLPVAVVSCNVYADRAETIILGKAVRDAILSSGKRVVVAAVSNLTQRLFPRPVPLAEDRVSSRQDDEWNQKLLEIFAEGRLEDVSQLARTFASQARADAKLKGVWWLAAAAGAHNGYRGEVLAYAPVQGAGCAVVSLRPDASAAAQLEFDEDDVDVFRGDRGVLAGGEARPPAAAPARPAPPPAPAPAIAPAPAAPQVAISAPQASPPSSTVARSSTPISTSAAPAPVGAYPHARRVGDLLFLSGVGPRQPGTNAIPGGPVRDAEGRPLDYDVAAQTRAVIENVRRILEAAGSRLEDILDVTVFLINMDRDFAAYNAVYNEVFASIGATRTTLAISALPTPIAVELKVLAAARGPA
jgi:2-aminomuconate deaminase